MSTASFGWEINAINGNGANMIIPVAKPIVLTSIQASISMMFMSSAQGASEVYACAWAFPEKPVFDNTGGHAFFNLTKPLSPDFGPMTFYDPNGIKPHGDGGSHVQDALFAAILKSYAPASTCQNIQVPHKIPIAAGSFLVFHLDHWGVPVDIECDGTFTYEATQAVAQEPQPSTAGS
jgi:hypothetical protein